METHPEIPYQVRDYNIVDYQLWPLKDEKRDKVHILRGPQPSSLIKNNYFACLGSATALGCYAQQPYSLLLQKQLSFPSLNLSIAGAGATLYLQEENRLLIDLANDSKFVIVLVMSGRCHPSRRFLPPKVGKLKGPKLMKKYQQLHQTDKTLFRKTVNQMRESFVKDYIRLSKRIKPPKILLYLSTRKPQYEDNFSKSFIQAHQGFPHFINKSTIQGILPCFDEYIECVSSRGFPQKLISRFTGKPTTNGKGETHNSYYASPEMHEDTAQMLLSVCQKYLNLGKD
jgi:hypothetical protein